MTSRRQVLSVAVIVVALVLAAGSLYLWTRRVEGEVRLPAGGPDRGSADLVLLVHSPICSSAFDGHVDFAVQESDDDVVVTATLRPPLVIFGCDLADAAVERTVVLNRPLGNRRLLDGSTQPPTVVSSGTD